MEMLSPDLPQSSKLLKLPENGLIEFVPLIFSRSKKQGILRVKLPRIATH
jgi:hypothetical protein